MPAPENGFTCSPAMIVQVRSVSAGAALRVKPATVMPRALACPPDAALRLAFARPDGITALYGAGPGQAALAEGHEDAGR